MPAINSRENLMELSEEERTRINEIIDKKRAEEDLEAYIESIGPQSTTRNFKKDYGIDETLLKLLTTSSLENIYIGTQLVDIPHEMLVMNNAHEILGQYLAVGKIKSNQAIHKKLGKYTSTHIDKLIREINKVAYAGTGLGNVKAKEEKPHYDELQSERMKFLPTRFTKRFISSFINPHKVNYLHHSSSRDSYIDAILYNIQKHRENEITYLNYKKSFLRQGKGIYETQTTDQFKEIKAHQAKDLLVRYWDKFRDNQNKDELTKRQDISNYSDMKLIRLFNHIYESLQDSIKDSDLILNQNKQVNDTNHNG